jgi:hypothetical protein
VDDPKRQIARANVLGWTAHAHVDQEQGTLSYWVTIPPGLQLHGVTEDELDTMLTIVENRRG